MMAIYKTFDNLYEAYDATIDEGEEMMGEKYFQMKLDELVAEKIIVLGPITTEYHNDENLYMIHKDITYKHCEKIRDPVKRFISFELVHNLSTFFIYQPTQMGKNAITSNELVKWAKDTTKKAVAFLMFANDQPLSVQSCIGIEKVFAEHNIKIKIFRLACDNKITMESIKDNINGYAADRTEEGEEPEYGMPIICSLDNPTQRKKTLSLIKYIHKKVETKKSLLRYGMIWDEADKTYASARDVEYTIEGEAVSFKKYIVDKNDALYRLGFASATEGDLIIDDNYPECANAYIYPVIITPDIQANYRSLHHPEAVSHFMPYSKKKHNPNSYAMGILKTHSEHFQTPIVLPNGNPYFRKVIINSRVQTKEMESIAIWCNENNFHALVINGAGGGRASIKVYKKGKLSRTYKLKFENVSKSLNERIYYIYKTQKMNDKPLVIIGMRKIDRGLSFHYCPRADGEVIIRGEEGEIVSQDKDGIVFTDMILGHIPCKDTAVQKAGRLAGVIGSSPQYPGSIHYWIDERTDIVIRQQLKTVITTNEIAMQNSSLTFEQSLKRAKNANAHTHSSPSARVNHETDQSLYRTYNSEQVMRNVYKELYNREYPQKFKKNPEGFVECSIFAASKVQELCDVIKHIPTAIKSGGGAGGGETVARKLFPCYKDISDPTSIHFVMLLDPAKITKEQVETIDANYDYITVPQKGDF
jgi:hypothetical protein